MKIKVLVDNISNDSYFKKEWGLSILIKHSTKNILLDFGQSDKFIKNAKPLDIDLKEVDYAVLSHAHYDHANGLNHFIKLNTSPLTKDALTGISSAIPSYLRIRTGEHPQCHLLRTTP